MPRIGVYICHCGENIAGAVNVEEVRKYAEQLPGVVLARNYLFMCSDPGQELIKQDIRNGLIDRVVVAACTPRTHEPIFRKAVEDGGLNKYLLEMANIRDQDSWPHWQDKEGATEKAKKLVASAVAKATYLEPLEDRFVEVTRASLVVGGGVSGMFAALDLANMGYKVYLVEKNPSVGGNMAKLDKTFPTNDCSACILTPIMVQVGTHPNIELLTYSEVESVEGSVGNFKVKVRKKQTYIDWDKCTGCGDCVNACPAKVPNEFNEGMNNRKAIYIEFPQAVPKRAVVDIEHCLNCAKRVMGTQPRIHSKTGEPILAPCEKACKTGACDRSRAYNPEGELIELNVGTIIIATGYKVMDKEPFKEYSPQSPNVITAMQLERILSATGPTDGQLKRPSDGEKPKTIAFISCVGSRDKRFHTYCSKVCCMYMLKEARLIKEKYPNINIYIFFIDVRTGGKDFEEYYNYCRNLGIRMLRGRVGAVDELPGDRLRVRAFDVDLGAPVELEADLVVLATAIEPAPALEELGRKMGITCGSEGFLKELHTKLYPVETSVKGIYIAGCAQGPKDIPESVSQARAASSAAAVPLTLGKVIVEPLISEVNQRKCSGCGTCVQLCPYSAISLVEDKGKLHSKIDEALCAGCGICAAACPSGVITLHGFTNTQIFAQIKALAS
ncbi:CoB--CoM heterodisulfide reductase iron-sulfur subunit A family protein [Desulfofundulus thermocisternus]|uniref:CoB--CoM heterodisulfide reductase iron-sulfur subunit A family protein n=1 Tax=Desulfofundulus thermocisternus TaxID=42471 RepID=UPI00217DC82A|nr:CoB--CoM heterodisulfide reductase iron-sulfur subunit A family protein [Desulfofundulus thermocisternus]MCS5695802.1 CoB--CoM heterodisulfide reductase iron-sulfur subunit A family protein [Desulfofundulus thermocisternus]